MSALCEFIIENGVLTKYEGGSDTVVIPDGITHIGKGAFRYCTNLCRIVIPDSVTEIGDQAFSFCTKLTDVIVPDGVTRIGCHAFRRCKNLKILRF